MYSSFQFAKVGSRSFICCTIRTIELYQRFKKGIENCGLKTAEHKLEQKNIWYYNKYADIVVLEIWNEFIVWSQILYFSKSTFFVLISFSTKSQN